jgi:bifunctional NMN adenylyltransferase/nudix hydrolase
MEKSKELGVIVARFHTDMLTEGHEALLKHVMERHEHVVIFLGTRSTPPTSTNPLHFLIRAEMVRQAVPNAAIIPLQDMREDSAWSANLDKLIDERVAGFGARIYCGRDSFGEHYTTKKWPVEMCSFGCDEVSASRRRKLCRTQYVNNKDFRRGIIHAMEVLPYRIYETVDMAMVKRLENGDFEILLARKPHETAWRFPGGFVGMGETFAHAAGREMREETGLVSEGGWTYVNDYLINDWRIRDARNVCHRTVLMLGWYSWGVPKADDDIAEVKWFPFREVQENAELLMVEEHRVLMVDRLFAEILNHA